MKFDADNLMQLAIKVMRDSKAEKRPDGKAVPLVGAVLWMPDESFDFASRGELREGDHAEFTLLERKNRNKKLDGSVLFATLEPCAPGARKHPKLGCAERIVNARIKKVYVGIEDPDPTVDRKGIKFLQDNGVEVVMFPRMLQEEIREANKEFLEQASKRALEAEVETIVSRFPPRSGRLPRIATRFATLCREKQLEKHFSGNLDIIPASMSGKRESRGPSWQLPTESRHQNGKDTWLT